MSRLDTCPVDSLPRYGDLSKIFGMVWRFLPLLDPLVDAVASRDLDSRLTAREAAAVTQWLEESGLPFHVMRDHPMHGTEILGGMWGARLDTGHRDQLRGAMERLLASVSSHTRHTSSLILSSVQDSAQGWRKGQDQTLLTKFVWPEVKEVSCVHDSYLCTVYRCPHLATPCQCLYQQPPVQV